MKELIENANEKQLEKASVIFDFINNRDGKCNLYWKTIAERIQLRGEIVIHDYVNQVLKEVLTS